MWTGIRRITGWAGRTPPAICATALLAIGAAGPAVAQSSCRVDLRELSKLETQDDYDPFLGDLVDYHQFKVEHRRGPGCAFAVTIDRGENGDRVMDRGHDLLDYELYVDPAHTQPVSDVNGPSGGWFTGFVTDIDDGVDEIQFQIVSVIPGGQLAPKGTYNDHVQVTIYELESGIPTRTLASRRVQVKTKVREVVQTVVYINGVPRALSGVVGTVDLGELTNGGEASFDLEVMGNDEFDLILSSENAGQLRAPGNPTGIPYTVRVNGASVRLDGSSVVRLDGDRDRRYSLTVSAESVTRALAGTYGDNLYLTVEAQ